MKKPLLERTGAMAGRCFCRPTPVRAGRCVDAVSGVLAWTNQVLTVAGQRRTCTGLPREGCMAYWR